MTNHILHPLGDRTMCSPDNQDSSAVHICTDPALSSCTDCNTAYEQQECLRVSLGLTSNRREELHRRAAAAIEAGKHRDSDSVLTVTPAEVLTLLSEAGVDEASAVLQGIVPPHSREGHWEAGAVKDGRRDFSQDRKNPEIIDLYPPVTPGPGAALKPDYNYSSAVPDTEIDRRAREMPHGWIVAREDESHAKCGGPVNACGQCRREEEIFEAGDQTIPVEAQDVPGAHHPKDKVLDLLQQALYLLAGDTFHHRLLSALCEELKAKTSGLIVPEGERRALAANGAPPPPTMKDTV